MRKFVLLGLLAAFPPACFFYDDYDEDEEYRPDPCGNGVVEPEWGEECDDGSSRNSYTTPDACRYNCTLPRCGDYVADSGEQCDHEDLRGETCESRGHTGGVLVCTEGCGFHEEGCHTCGDGHAEGSPGAPSYEQCDGEDLRGLSCEGLGRGAGSLGCQEDCTLDLSGCASQDATCGNGVWEEGEACDDGRPASGDGCSSSCQPERPYWVLVPDLWTEGPYGVGTYGQVANDEARGILVSYQCHNPGSETWLYADGSWLELPEDPAVGSFSGTLLTYDSARERVVLFASRDSVGEDPRSETWELGPQGWVPLESPSPPPPRFGSAMAYDRSRRRLVLYGGKHDSVELGHPELGDTWEHDGATWHRVETSASPGLRSGHAMAYDQRRGKVVLFGGSLAGSSSPRGDTWEYDGTAWVERTGHTAPGRRLMPQLVFDPARGQVLLYGGWIEAAYDRSDLSLPMQWDGSEWWPLDDVNRPIPGSGGRLVPAAPWAGHLILLGASRDPSSLNDRSLYHLLWR